MKPSTSLLVLLVLVLAFPFVTLAQEAAPRMTVVEPDTAKAGDTVSVTGENLAKPMVSEVFLTDGKNDYKVVIVEQAATGIKFTVPANVKPGRLSLMVLTGGKPPKLIEEPVKINIE